MKTLLKYFPKIVFFESLIIIIISIIIGFIVNIFHPKKVTLTLKRPQLERAADTLLAQELPEVEIADDSQNEETNDSAFIVSTTQLISLIENKKALIIDARYKSRYDEEHIPNSINLPIEEIYEYDDTIKSLPKNKWLICYCDDPECDLAKLLAFELMNFNFNKILYYKGGLQDWKENNFPTIKTGANNEK